MIPLDESTFQRAQEALRRAHQLGLDPVEALHRSGLLLSPAAQHRIRVETLEFIASEMASWRPAEFLRSKFPASKPTTPADMYICILEWVEKHVAAAKEAK